MSFSTAGAVQGGISGAQAGASSGSGWGALFGGLAGIGLGGAFGGQQNYGFSPSQLQEFYGERLAQISQFNNQYIGAINEYQNNANNIATQTFNKFFAPGVLASLSATGFNPNSGAMNTALANTSELMQANLLNTAFGATQNRLSQLNQAETGAFGIFGGGASYNVAAPHTPAWLTGVGQLGASMFNSSLQSGGNNAPGSGGFFSSFTSPNTTPNAGEQSYINNNTVPGQYQSQPFGAPLASNMPFFGAGQATGAYGGLADYNYGLGPGSNMSLGSTAMNPLGVAANNGAWLA